MASEETDLSPGNFSDLTEDLLLESPGNFSDPESCLVFAGFAFKIKFQ